MRAEINGVTIHGTVDEMILLVNSLQKATEGSQKASRGRSKKTYDWDGAVALRNAGWTAKQIAEELGCSEQTVRNHFKGEE